MRNITYKYSVGDYVKFKDKLAPTASCGLAEKAGFIAKITERFDYGSACYALEGYEGVFTENCFDGLASEAPINSPYHDKAIGADTLQGSAPSCDTEDSGESKNKAEWFTINHSIPVYACSSCHAPALCDPRGRAVDSKFCPHCGKFMINYTPEDDDYEM
jgi:hypothetical protein